MIAGQSPGSVLLWVTSVGNFQQVFVDRKKILVQCWLLMELSTYEALSISWIWKYMSNILVVYTACLRRLSFEERWYLWIIAWISSSPFAVLSTEAHWLYYFEPQEAWEKGINHLSPPYCLHHCHTPSMNLLPEWSIDSLLADDTFTVLQVWF